jgi:hypothetical protein
MNVGFSLQRRSLKPTRMPRLIEIVFLFYAETFISTVQVLCPD